MRYILDFDGTIATRDVGAVLLGRFAPATWRLLDWAMRRSFLSPRRGQALQWRFVTAPVEVLRGEAARCQLRDGFSEFVRRVTARGDAVHIVTSGFRWYVEALLGPLMDLVDLTSNALVPARGGYRLVSPARRLCCPRHSPCKAPFLHGDATMVGDGVTDTCALATPARVYAVKDSYLHARACAAGRDVTPFTSFHELD